MVKLFKGNADKNTAGKTQWTVIALEIVLASTTSTK